MVEDGARRPGGLLTFPTEAEARAHGQAALATLPAGWQLVVYEVDPDIASLGWTYYLEHGRFKAYPGEGDGPHGWFANFAGDYRWNTPNTDDHPLHRATPAAAVRRVIRRFQEFKAAELARLARLEADCDTVPLPPT